jgi:hypothetical protein
MWQFISGFGAAAFFCPDGNQLGLARNARKWPWKHKQHPPE